MKYIIVNSSTNIEYRVDLLYEYLTAAGNEVLVIASDYVHAEKRWRSVAKHPYLLLPTKAYRKNISVGRLYSHYCFSRDAYREIRQTDADVLYLVIPQNSNAEIAEQYRRDHPNTKIIMDIVDLWPESLPFRGTRFFPFSLWANVRNRHLKDADIVITECKYYQKQLKKWLKGKLTETIPWLKRWRPWNSRFEQTGWQLPEGELRFCYLGAVNHIVDIDRIGQLLKLSASVKKTKLHLIGIGESKDRLKQTAVKAGAEVIDHGAVYDETEKQRIMDECHFGLNVMKASVSVGLSMKSIDYLAAGLPILNSLPGDSAALAAQKGVGLNLPVRIEELLQFQADRRAVRRMFEAYFSDRSLPDYWKKLGLGDGEGERQRKKQG